MTLFINWPHALLPLPVMQLVHPVVPPALHPPPPLLVLAASVGITGSLVIKPMHMVIKWPGHKWRRVPPAHPNQVVSFTYMITPLICISSLTLAPKSALSLPRTQNGYDNTKISACVLPMGLQLRPSESVPPGPLPYLQVGVYHCGCDLGADFLPHFGLIVNMQHDILSDPMTSCPTPTRIYKYMTSHQTNRRSQRLCG